MTTGPLPAPSKYKSGRFNVPRVMKTMFPATVMVFSVVSSEGHIMPPRSRLESQHQSVPGCAEECGDPLVQSSGRWQTLGVAVGLGTGLQVQRDPVLASEGVLRLCTLLSLTPSSPDLNPLDYFVWSYVENITNMTSHNTKASLIAAIRAPAGACGKGMLPVPDSYRGWDWAYRRLYWIDVSSAT